VVAAAEGLHKHAERFSPDGVPEIRDDQTPGTPGPHLTELVPVHLLSEAAELEVDDRAG
jgi:hypothetical protein